MLSTSSLHVLLIGDASHPDVPYRSVKALPVRTVIEYIYFRVIYAVRERAHEIGTIFTNRVGNSTPALLT